MFFKDPVWLPKLVNGIFILFGLGGLLLLFLWFGTRHGATQWNCNLLWLNPLCLVIPFIKNKPIRSKIILVILLINSLLLLLWGAIPQSLNVGIIPLVLMMILISTVAYFKLRVASNGESELTI